VEKKLHNEELHDLYCSPNIFRVIKSRGISWAGHVACMGERRGFWWGTEGKRPLRRLRHRWEDNIKIFNKWDEGHGLDRSGSG
jgi:hypothetical protein